MPAVRYLSNDVVLEPEQWRVRVGDSFVTPEPKVFELLCYLMQNRGRVVPKGELLDALWSGDVVGESVLTRCVSCARKVLADDSKTPRFIRTFHGRGYQFIAPVTEGRTHGASATEAATATAETPVSVEPPATERLFVGRTSELARLRDALPA